MKNYFKDTKSQSINSNEFYDILIEVAKQFHEIYSESHKLSAYVGSQESSWDGFIEHRLTIMTLENRSPYFYNLIRVKQAVGNFDKAEVSAFLNPPTDPEMVNPIQFDAFIINNVINTQKFRDIIEMMHQMGKSIKSWEE